MMKIQQKRREKTKCAVQSVREGVWKWQTMRREHKTSQSNGCVRKWIASKRVIER